MLTMKGMTAKHHVGIASLIFLLSCCNLRVIQRSIALQLDHQGFAANPATEADMQPLSNTASSLVANPGLASLVQEDDAKAIKNTVSPPSPAPPARISEKPTIVGHTLEPEEEKEAVASTNEVKDHVRPGAASPVRQESTWNQTTEAYLSASTQRHEAVSEASNQQVPEQTDNNSPFVAKSLWAPQCDSLSADAVDFTLVTQLSPDRLWLMEEHCKRWGPHPMSVAIAGTTSKEDISKSLEAFGCHMPQMQLSVIENYEDTGDYPINELRNMAFSKVQTSHIISVDVDFLLSSETHKKLQLQRELLALDAKVALVIPAFQLKQKCRGSSEHCQKKYLPKIPTVKSRLAEMFTNSSSEEQVIPFDGRQSRGHGSTKYDEWVEQRDDQVIEITRFKSPYYEPYLVLRYCYDLPPFQEVFKGYGLNKITWISHLRHVGYRFFQIGHSFVLHFPHAQSVSKKRWKKNKMDKMGAIAREFHEWLALSVPVGTH